MEEIETALDDYYITSGMQLVAEMIGWINVGTHLPTGEVLYVLRPEIARWVETQPVHLWAKLPNRFNTPYTITEELLSWMILKWK